MGIGRREFIRLTGIALTGLVIDPLKAVAINEDAYVNKKLGILFYKPKGWTFISIKDFGILKDKQILGEGLGLSKEEIWHDSDTPICIATKYDQSNPENKGFVSPIITLNISSEDEFDGLEYENLEDLAELWLEGVSLLLKDFKVIKKYEPQYISNCRFYEYDTEYLFEHVDISKPARVELKILKTEHNGLHYSFHCHQSVEQNQIADKEFEYFKKTIKLI